MMDPSLLPKLLGVAVLLPLASFVVILFAGPRLGKAGAYIAIGAILGAAVLSFASLGVWLTNHWPEAAHHGEHAAEHDSTGHNNTEHEEGESHAPASKGHGSLKQAENPRFVSLTADESEPSEETHAPAGHGGEGNEGGHAGHAASKPSYTGEYYTLGRFGSMKLTISYYIDTLTICMFCMVTLIATCIHFYAVGYMHDELHDFTDHEVTLEDGTHPTRPGRYYRFFQYMSLFCFSMLGLVLAGNIAMVFVFWELVGICSYFLIGFYIERKSASNAANKAFIVNRVGDFGMIIGLMAIWASLGTFAFGDIEKADAEGHTHVEQGLFSLVRSEANDHALAVPAGMVRESAKEEVAAVVLALGPEASDDEIELAIASHIDEWRSGENKEGAPYGYWLLVIAGIGIFCGCVGKSAQFPLHVWLPDAMEGPTPVSALVHSATMVAAGVYLVGRFYPMFAPEVLLVIAATGCITLFMAATIAITATDIKRVLAYSTVSQLGYMMLALGVGGWLAGLMHLITHAFFKSLLFMCSGSVIHAVHSNEMTEMGGLRKKMPFTAYTMLVGCLAIAGASIPFVVGFSGYYSKDAILEQAYSFKLANNSMFGQMFFWSAAGGAAITAFYMFRMWYMTFAGKPRNQHRYDHAHESPKVMVVPLIILAVFAVSVAWTPFAWTGLSGLSLAGLLEQARPLGTAADSHGALVNLTWPNEHTAHLAENFTTIKMPVTLLAFATALAGFGLATLMYGLGIINPAEVKRQFQAIHRFLINKWWFDELYEIIFIRPAHVVARMLSGIDKKWIDGVLHAIAWSTRWFSVAFEWVTDQMIVDRLVNLMASWTYSLGASLKVVQTGRLRQYVLFIVVGAVAIFALISLFWNPTLAG